MAILTEGVSGPVTGRVGNLIFYQVKGQNRVRSLPRLTKRKPTPEQAAQRAKFKLMQDWLKLTTKNKMEKMHVLMPKLR